jgi:hypothetical protein
MEELPVEERIRLHEDPAGYAFWIFFARMVMVSEVSLLSLR